jgi:hypothetical protein
MDDRRDNGTDIEWLCAGSPATEHIRPAQTHLFKKYVKVEPTYLTHTGKITDWGKSIAAQLPVAPLVVFGLDDFLPIDYLAHGHFNFAAHLTKLNPQVKRVELGIGCLNHRPLSDHNLHYRYQEETPYSVSTQFSVWNTTELYKLLESSTDPWDFETGRKTKAACLKTPALRYIEESAVSTKKGKGKINLCGLRQYDIDQLIDLKLVDPERIIYGWRGNEQRTKEAYGPKYAPYF